MKILKYILSFFRAKKTKETKDTSIHIPNGLLNHFRYEDESGETMGCGCDICLARHAKYNAEKRLDALEYKTLKIKEITGVYLQIIFLHGNIQMMDTIAIQFCHIA